MIKYTEEIWILVSKNYMRKKKILREIIKLTYYFWRCQKDWTRDHGQVFQILLLPNSELHLHLLKKKILKKTKKGVYFCM